MVVLTPDQVIEAILSCEEIDDVLHKFKQLNKMLSIATCPMVDLQSPHFKGFVLKLMEKSAMRDDAQVIIHFFSSHRLTDEAITLVVRQFAQKWALFGMAGNSSATKKGESIVVEDEEDDGFVGYLDSKPTASAGPSKKPVVSELADARDLLFIARAEENAAFDAYQKAFDAYQKARDQRTLAQAKFDELIEDLITEPAPPSAARPLSVAGLAAEERAGRGKPVPGGRKPRGRPPRGGLGAH